MAIILESTDSAYYPCFRTLFGNVVSSLAEAKEISLYLTPLRRCFKAIEEIDFSEAKPIMATLIHTVGLAWAKSRYYQSSSKLIIMLRQISNLLIQEARRFLDPSSIFQSDVDEALQRVQISRGESNFLSIVKFSPFSHHSRTNELPWTCKRFFLANNISSNPPQCMNIYGLTLFRILNI